MFIERKSAVFAELSYEVVVQLLEEALGNRDVLNRDAPETRVLRKLMTPLQRSTCRNSKDHIAASAMLVSPASGAALRRGRIRYPLIAPQIVV